LENENAEDGNEEIEGFSKRGKFLTPLPSKSRNIPSIDQNDWLSPEDGNHSDDDTLVEGDQTSKEDQSGPNQSSEIEGDEDLNFSDKKKKKKKKISATGNDCDVGVSIPTYETWLESDDHEYRYDELLGRIFHLLREKNPELTQLKNRYVIRTPTVVRVGTKKNRLDKLCRYI